LIARKPRILVAKPGLDNHDRGAKIVAYYLRDAGMEVIYTGIRCTPEQIVRDALQESVDIIGLSILSGAHMKLVSKIFQLLKDYEAEDIQVILGGPINRKDAEKLKTMGVKRIYTPGTGLKEITDSVFELTQAQAS
jgi:methylmalonyl-CoA mutase C-terminal domain/subunit